MKAKCLDSKHTPKLGQDAMAPQATQSTEEKPSPWAEIDIASLPRQALVVLCKDAGLPAFRADQLFRWLHVRHVRS